MKKILYMTNIPVPYKVDFFNKLCKYIDLTVVFERKSANNRNEKWLSSKKMGFKAIFLQGVNVGEENAFCPGIHKIISKGNFDGVVASVYQTPTEMMATEFMRREKIPYFISTDGGFIKSDNAVKRMVKTHFLSGARGYFSPSAISDDYLTYYGVQRELIHRYPFTSISKNKILKGPLSLEEKKNIRKELNIKEKKIILGVGQIIHRKGWDLLIKTSIDFPSEVGFYVIGGKATEGLLQLIQEHKISNIHFIDFKSTQLLENYYKAADMFVLPTREDIWGLVVNEAMAYGLPVITTDKCIAGLEMVKNGENGYIIETNNPIQLGEKIRLLLETDMLRYEIGNNNLKKASNYTIEKMAYAYGTVLNN